MFSNPSSSCSGFRLSPGRVVSSRAAKHLDLLAQHGDLELELSVLLGNGEQFVAQLLVALREKVALITQDLEAFAQIADLFSVRLAEL